MSATETKGWKPSKAFGNRLIARPVDSAQMPFTRVVVFYAGRMTNPGLWEQNGCERRQGQETTPGTSHARGAMKATKELHDLGQSLWLDNITRDLLDNGTLKRYVDEFSITGLTSNPTIFEHAISKSKSY